MCASLATTRYTTERESKQMDEIQNIAKAMQHVTRGFDLGDYFMDYTDGKITLERLAEKLGVNYYTLHKAFIHYHELEVTGRTHKRREMVQEADKQRQEVE